MKFELQPAVRFQDCYIYCLRLIMIGTQPIATMPCCKNIPLGCGTHFDRSLRYRLARIALALHESFYALEHYAKKTQEHSHSTIVCLNTFHMSLRSGQQMNRLHTLSRALQH